jgi:hypothetical protein
VTASFLRFLPPSPPLLLSLLLALSRF